MFVRGEICLKTPQPIYLPCNNFLHITVSEIQPRQNFKDQGHYSKVKGQNKVIPELSASSLL